MSTDDPRLRKNKTPSLLSRDPATNKLIDPNQGHKVADQLLEKLLTEQRAADKDNSMHIAKTGKRDIVVHLAVTVLGEVDGHPIVGDKKEREYGQWCFRINARSLPMRNSNVIRAFSELCHVGKQALMKMGMVSEG